MFSFYAHRRPFSHAMANFMHSVDNPVIKWQNCAQHWARVSLEKERKSTVLYFSQKFMIFIRTDLLYSVDVNQFLVNCSSWVAFHLMHQWTKNWSMSARYSKSVLKNPTKLTFHETISEKYDSVIEIR